MTLQRMDFETTGKLVRGAILAVTLLGFGSAAQAALVPCDASFVADGTAKVTGGSTTDTAVSACEYDNDNDNNGNVASIGNINEAGFFGFSDWTGNFGNVDVQVGEELTGSWAINNPDFATYDYIIVFKDGNDTGLVGFLFNEEFSSGLWSSPFTSALFPISETKDVSHYTIAQRTPEGCPPNEPGCGEQEIPEPGALALLGIGLAGAGFFSRRRKP